MCWNRCAFTWNGLAKSHLQSQLLSYYVQHITMYTWTSVNFQDIKNSFFLENNWPQNKIVPYVWQKTHAQPSDDRLDPMYMRISQFHATSSKEGTLEYLVTYSCYIQYHFLLSANPWNTFLALWSSPAPVNLGCELGGGSYGPQRTLHEILGPLVSLELGVLPISTSHMSAYMCAWPNLVFLLWFWESNSALYAHLRRILLSEPSPQLLFSCHLLR